MLHLSQEDFREHDGNAPRYFRYHFKCQLPTSDKETKLTLVLQTEEQYVKEHFDELQDPNEDVNHKREGTFQFYDLESPPKYRSHDCSPDCLGPSVLDPSVPLLMKPLHSGWKRYICLMVSKKTERCPEREYPQTGYEGIIYITPCGVPIKSMSDMHHYLKMLQCPLSIRSFTFEEKVFATRYFKHRQSRKLSFDDISGGEEKCKIGLINHSFSTKPEPFRYTQKRQLRVPPPESSRTISCSCITCELSCPCIQETLKFLPGSSQEPVYTDGRLLKEITTGIHECSELCKCSLSCSNRLAQHDEIQELQVFYTRRQFFGCRTMTDIAKGSFICSYTGLVLPRDKISAKSLSDMMYVSGLDVISPRISATEEKLMGDLSRSERTKLDKRLERLKDKNTEQHIRCVDAKECGNVSRFINHSCAPNCFMQKVFFSTNDILLPDVAIFAKTNIIAGTELTYDYGGDYRTDDGKHEKCLCGSERCQRYLT